MAINFDNIISGAKDIFDKASVKAGEAIDYSKTQIDRTQLKVKLKEKYCELGKACYESKTKGTDKTMAIEKLANEITDINAKLAESEPKKSKVCPSCHTENSTESAYCRACGGKLD